MNYKNWKIISTLRRLSELIIYLNYARIFYNFKRPNTFVGHARIIIYWTQYGVANSWLLFFLRFENAVMLITRSKTISWISEIVNFNILNNTCLFSPSARAHWSEPITTPGSHRRRKIWISVSNTQQYPLK